MAEEGDYKKALVNRPELKEELLFYWIAFNDLLTKQGISFTDIKNYIELYKVQDIDFFITAVKALEAELMRLQNDRIQSTNRNRQQKSNARS